MPLNPHRLVVRCCYAGMFVQAMVINLAPLLFIPLKDEMGLTFEQVGRLILINFLTQMTVDLVCCGLADRVSAKLLIVLANLLAGAGLWGFALAPGWLERPYDGLVLGTVIFSAGCGLLEVLISPLLNAVPSERKASDMALLHAFYPIGKVAVILATGLALLAFGTSRWRGIMLAWSLVPFLTATAFLAARLPPFAPEGRRQTLRELIRIPTYRFAVLVLALAGATELTLAQWASAYAERGLGFSKAVADLVGFSLFGAGMIAGRLAFGVKGETLNLHRLMVQGALLAAGMCLVMSLSPWPAAALACSAAAGLAVSLLWPGTLSLSAARFPLAGASMFALLAAAGDAGAGLMPWGLGVVADRVAGAVSAWPGLLAELGLNPEALGLRAGLLATTLCPLSLALLLWRRGPSEWRPGPPPQGPCGPCPDSRRPDRPLPHPPGSHPCRRESGDSPGWRDAPTS
jgi:fucose permease